MPKAPLVTPWLVILVAIVSTPAWAELKPKVPVVVCPRVAQAPTMDGHIDPGEWAAAGYLSDFMLLGASGLPKLPTRVYVMHTVNSLYIGVQAYDPKPSELAAEATERDGEVYEDDCIEIFIDTEGYRKHYAHFVVNSLGTKYDAFDKDKAENFEWDVFAAVNDDGWAVEMELPFDQSIPPLEGESWNIAVCRNAPGAGELSSWARHERGFHEADAFGAMRFVGPLLTGRMDDLGDRSWGDNLALLTLHNLSDQPTAAKVYAVAMGRDRRSHYFGTVKQTVEPNGTAQVYVPYKIRRCGPAWIALSVSDEKGTVAWRSAAFPVDLPELSDPLDEASHDISVAWKAWSTMGASATKDRWKSRIDALQAQWRYLDSQVSGGTGASGIRLQALALEAQGLRDQAARLQADVCAAAEE